jgi:putative ABC transport system ATP-binding protein
MRASGTSMNVVECRGVTKTFGEGGSEVQALRGVDIAVKEGELMMLVGPSGCGKTTLISVIAGVLDATQGECKVFGESMQEMRSNDRTRYRGKNIGFVFQQFNLIPSLTLKENVGIPLMINGMAYGEAVDRGEETLARVGLRERSNDRPTQLSGGQQQRIAIARAIVHSPRLVVCDEPTSALDHVTGQHVVELLREVASGEGRALVVVTHDSRIFQYADRIARMDDGRIQSTYGSYQEMQASEKVLQ